MASQEELNFIEQWNGEPVPLLRPQVVKEKSRQTIYLRYAT